MLANHVCLALPPLLAFLRWDQAKPRLSLSVVVDNHDLGQKVKVHRMQLAFCGWHHLC